MAFGAFKVLAGRPGRNRGASASAWNKADPDSRMIFQIFSREGTRETDAGHPGLVEVNRIRREDPIIFPVQREYVIIHRIIFFSDLTPSCHVGLSGQEKQ